MAGNARGAGGRPFTDEEKRFLFTAFLGTNVFAAGIGALLFEAFAWLLIGGGTAIMTWGLFKASRAKKRP